MQHFLTQYEKAVWFILNDGSTISQRETQPKGGDGGGRVVTNAKTNQTHVSNMPVIIIVVVVFGSDPVTFVVISVSCGEVSVGESELRTTRATVTAIATPSKRATTTARRAFTYNLRFLCACGLKVECI